MSDGYIPVELRRMVRERARNCCEFCRYLGRYSPQTMSVDHLIPRQAGGETIADNLALSCQGCNSHKAARTMASDSVTGALVPLFNPRRHKWNEHFAWSPDFLQITGLTATGRATVDALQLNREGLINMRRVLYTTGEHPPSEIE